jgi:pyruvate kinase
MFPAALQPMNGKNLRLLVATHMFISVANTSVDAVATAVEDGVDAARVAADTTSVPQPQAMCPVLSQPLTPAQKLLSITHRRHQTPRTQPHQTVGGEVAAVSVHVALIDF